MMPRKIRLGVIVPSSNTALEPLTQQIVASLVVNSDTPADVTVHFARFRVTKIALSADADAQFAHDAMLEAARLLADAHVDIIGWSGTAASWLGLRADVDLCAAIKASTGIPATSAVLGMMDVLITQGAGNTKIGLVTPYTQDVHNEICKNLGKAGFVCPPERGRCAGLSENVLFASIDDEQLDGMLADVVGHGADTVLIMCTNVRAAHRAKHWETRYGIRVLDSVATTVVGMLNKLKLEVEPSSVADWGSVL
ncbi:asp glu hydantoin racemase [Ophiostoma piceae UAMH 11346]|uniref:Asp glu hydantoin racemase n=1 Tax=Ophiostoma piceae (strain UAMH 11346) TaxID=1262450 RepID=S3BV62_OPHP1|nr:asp glu hydantoin racemase [Ophiostoma piceae UAMH 11346]